MNFTDYSEHFGKDKFVACISHNDNNYKKLDKRKLFVSNLSLESDNLVIPNQIHSKNVSIINRSGIYNNTDGLISTKRDYVLSILVADCVPLFLLCTRTNYLALIHSGWRGAENNISSVAINNLKSLGVRPLDIKAVIGPSINQCCFEVDKDVAEKFNSNYSINRKKSKFLLNLSMIVYDQLADSGISKDNILLDNNCTYCCNKTYFSFRREGKSSGRMVAVAGWY